MSLRSGVTSIACRAQHRSMLQREGWLEVPEEADPRSDPPRYLQDDLAEALREPGVEVASVEPCFVAEVVVVRKPA